MSRRRMIQAAALALVLAASAPIAHAGGGGAGSPVSAAMFDCYLISGTANVPQVLTIDDQFGELTGVKLGKAKLLCTPAAGIVESGQLMPGDFSDGDHLKCYDAPPSGTNPQVTEVVADPFVTETVQVGVPRYVCVQAFKCPVGESCPPE